MINLKQWLSKTEAVKPELFAYDNGVYLLILHSFQFVFRKNVSSVGSRCGPCKITPFCLKFYHEILGKSLDVLHQAQKLFFSLFVSVPYRYNSKTKLSIQSSWNFGSTWETTEKKHVANSNIFPAIGLGVRWNRHPLPSQFGELWLIPMELV